MEGFQYRPVAAGLFVYIQIAKQRDTIAENVENAATFAATSRIFESPKLLREMERNRIFAFADGDGIAEIAVTLSGVEVTVAGSLRLARRRTHLPSAPEVVRHPGLPAGIQAGFIQRDHSDGI